MVCLETCLTCTSPTFPREPRIFFPVPTVWKKSQKIWYHLFWLVDLVVSCRFFTHQWWNPKKIREETLVPGHGQDFNTLFCTAWNKPKIALWNDWPRVHFVKEVGSYKMIRPAKNTFLQNGMVDQKNVLTKCLLLLEKCPWNGTWVKPFHSRNVHRDVPVIIIIHSMVPVTTNQSKIGFLMVDPHCTWCFFPGTSPPENSLEFAQQIGSWRFSSRNSQFFGQFDAKKNCDPKISHKVHWIPPFLTGAFYVGNEGMIHWLTINHNPINPQQPIQQPYVKRTSKCFAGHENPMKSHGKRKFIPSKVPKSGWTPSLLKPLKPRFRKKRRCLTAALSPVLVNAMGFSSWILAQSLSNSCEFGLTWMRKAPSEGLTSWHLWVFQGCWLLMGHPLVMTNSSPWCFNGPSWNRWFTVLNSMVDLSSSQTGSS